MDLAARQRHLCTAIADRLAPVFHRSHPELPVRPSSTKAIDDLVRELSSLGQHRHLVDREYHDRVEVLSRALELLDRHLPHPAALPDDRPHADTIETAWRVMLVMPMVDDAIARTHGKAQAPRRVRPW